MNKVSDNNNGRIFQRRHFVELAVFLFLILPSLVLSFFIVKQGNAGFNFTAIATILRDLSLVSLVLYFLWNNSEPFAALGLRTTTIWKEIGLGVLLFVPLFYASGILDNYLSTHGLHSPKTPLPSVAVGKGISEIVLATVLVVVVAFSEETIFRGYLMLRFNNVTSSTIWSVILSSFVFSLGHGYEGSAGVVTVGSMGAVFAIIYLWRGSLWAPMTMHFLQDFVAIVLAPFL